MATVTPTPPPGFRGGRLLGVALVVAALGALGLGLGLAFAPVRTLYAYLAAFAYAVSIAVGALFLLLIGYAANARWMSVIRRLCETVALAVVPLALLFVPLALGVHHVYPWASPPPDLPEHVQHLLHHKQPYLNVPAFLVRSGGYFAVWILVATLLRTWARRHHGSSAPPADPVRALGRERAFASAMLPLAALTITFAAFDWVMSLDPTWFSSMFGIYFFAGGFLGAIALVALLTWAGLRSGDLQGAITPHHFHALGRLLLAFTVFWAYTAYFQAFLIRIADKPEEVSFYLQRVGGSWRPYLVVLVLGKFALPFLLLLPRRPKFRPGYVAGVATWLLAFHLVDVYWLVLPALTPGGWAPHWLDLAALACVGGVVVGFGAWLARGHALVSERDPFFADGVRYASHT